jgi:hypothetical protein
MNLTLLSVKTMFMMVAGGRSLNKTNPQEVWGGCAQQNTTANWGQREQNALSSHNGHFIPKYGLLF